MSGAVSAGEVIDAWRALGHVQRVGDDDVFVIDAAPTGEGSGDPPLLVIHGFPTSSVDFSEVLSALRAERRVVLLDLPSYGLSSKPDRAYSLYGHADVVEAVVADLGIDEVDLLTHDMGDTVGGELLARHTAGAWDVEVTRRVVTNGSIYIDMAHLTDGQQLLLALPDELLPEGVGADATALAKTLAATFAEKNHGMDMTPHAELQISDGGYRILPRLIRYIEERRANERRFTGAIETHPSPLHIVWGPEDPIAVAEMAPTLQAARPDATLTWIDGAGHYPQIEDPSAWTAAVLAALDD